MTEKIKTTATDKELSLWEKIGEKIGSLGKMPLAIFNWVIKRIPLTAIEVALVHPNKNGIFLTWRDDQHFKGWHFPGSFIFFRESWRKACQRIINKEISTTVQIKTIQLLTAFNFHTLKQDSRGHAISLLIFVFPENLDLKSIESEKGIFFEKLPKEIMQVKLSPETANNSLIPDPPCSSHEIMFKAAIGHLTDQQDYLSEVKNYQISFC